MKKYFPVFLTALKLPASSSLSKHRHWNNQPAKQITRGWRPSVGYACWSWRNGILIHDALGAVYGLKLTGNVGDVLRGDGTFGAGSSGGGSGAVWMLNGNSATDPTTDFIGTTDGQPVLFRVNNLFAGIIDPENTAFGLSSFIPSPCLFCLIPEYSVRIRKFFSPMLTAPITRHMVTTPLPTTFREIIIQQMAHLL